MNPHRAPGETIPDGRPLDPCPAQKCKARGRVVKVVKWHSDGITPYNTIRALVEPVACTPGARIRTGLLARCKEPGEHLHEHCRACGHRWITAFAGST